MGIWDRLGNVLKSYFNDGAERIFGQERPWQSHRDDDYNAAYDELEDFLRGEKAEGGTGESEKNRYEQERSKPRETHYKGRFIPSELKQDFLELGLSPGASEEECKEAYKKLLKIYHPDRHGKDSEQIKKATEKAARINAAYDRLITWFKQDK